MTVIFMALPSVACRRALIPRGQFRIGVPDTDWLLIAYARERALPTSWKGIFGAIELEHPNDRIDAD